MKTGAAAFFFLKIREFIYKLHGPVLVRAFPGVLPPPYRRAGACCSEPASSVRRAREQLRAGESHI